MQIASRIKRGQNHQTEGIVDSLTPTGALDPGTQVSVSYWGKPPPETTPTTPTTSSTPTDTTLAHQLQAATILENLWKKNPQHPGVTHYLIHSYDYPALAQRGLAPARASAIWSR